MGARNGKSTHFFYLRAMVDRTLIYIYNIYVHIFVHAHVFTVFPGCCGDKYADLAVGLADEYDSINPNA